MPLLELQEKEIKEIEEKRKVILKRIESVCQYLCSLGAKAVYIFGSVLTEDFRGYSDVDIAVEKLPYEYIYRVESRIEEILGGVSFDLIYLEYAPEHLVSRIKKSGKKYACHIS